MKIIVLGAFGKVGRAFISEAEKRGHEILAVARRKHDDLDFKNELIKDTLALTKEDVAGYDAIIDAISAWTPETFHVHTNTTSHIANLISGTDTRYIKVGGTGTVYINPEHSQQLRDWSEFPADLAPLGQALADSLDRVRSYSNVAWTYVSPAFNFDAEGQASGNYHVYGEDVDLDELLKTEISYADYVKALVDIIESGDYIRQRITIIGE